MSDTVLTATSGRATGSANARRQLATDSIPAVVYGMGMDPISISVPRRELRKALSGSAGMNTILDLHVDGDLYPAIVKDMQRDPVRRDVTHVDFLRIDRDAEISVEVPIVLVGEAEAVERENGNVTHSLFTLHITAKPDAIPNEIEVDISSLDIGDSIRVEDLQLPSGVTTDVDPEESIVTAQAQTLEELPEPTEGEEGEAAEGEAGDAEASTEGDSGSGDGDGGGDGE